MKRSVHDKGSKGKEFFTLSHIEWGGVFRFMTGDTYYIKTTTKRSCIQHSLPIGAVMYVAIEDGQIYIEPQPSKKAVIFCPDAKYRANDHTKYGGE